MMRKTKTPQNLWLLLALPVVALVSWVIGRFIGNHKQGATEWYPVSDQGPETPAPKDQALSPAAEPRELAAGHALRRQPAGGSIYYVLLVPFLILATAVVILALQRLPVQSQTTVPNGNPQAGQQALQSWGCGSCHTIPGVTGATGKVGPALSGLSERSYIAGHLTNTPDNMIQWIMHPQEISPGVDMPDTGVTESVARDMAAYLYSIH